MTIPRAEKFIEQYGFHNWLIHNLVDGLTHEESVMQLPFEANCMNWVLGHIVTNRSHVLEAAGKGHEWQDEVRNLYHTGTTAIKPGSKALRVEILLGHLDQSMSLLQETLQNVSEAWLDEGFTNYRGEKSREEHIRGFHWHEAYHIGQLEIFKDMALAGRKTA